MRGSLVALIFNKTLRMSTSAVSDASAITLMSTDIERIGSGLRDMHEIYSNFIEVVLALWLLARLLKIATVASTLVVIGEHIPLQETKRRVANVSSKVCLVAGIPLAVASGNAQGIWLEAVEERVAVTSKVLGVMKKHKNDRVDGCHYKKRSQTTITGDQSLVSLPTLYCLGRNLLLVNTLPLTKLF